MPDRDHWNATRYDGSDAGHYESFFLRANHPTEPRAFWIRYTIFSPKGRSAEALGELWAMAFDGERSHIVAARETRPLRECTFGRDHLEVRIGEATLGPNALEGSCASTEHRLRWSLRYTAPRPPLLLLDEPLYDGGFPKAKALVPAPHAVFTGTFEVDGERIDVGGWVGSQNHNWGSKHTDAYAWGQVAGFDDADDAFLECSTARIKIGPIWTPRFTVVVLRIGDEEIALNTLGQALRASGRYSYFTWDFDSRKGDVRVHGSISAPASAFVGLTYLNPPGGAKTCLNSKIARCEVTLEQPGQAPRTLTTASRAAFEILTDDKEHGVPVVV